MANEAIGTVSCPVGGCGELAKVYKFRAHESGRRSVFTGKLYCVCPKHGAWGKDGAPAANEWLLENAQLSIPAPEKPAAPPPDPAPEKPTHPRLPLDRLPPPPAGRRPSGLLID